MDPITVTQTAEQLEGKTLVTAEDNQAIAGLKTFDRGTSQPFGVSSPTAPTITNLDADKLDGQHGAFYRDASNLSAGTVPDARIPNPLPGVSGENLVNLQGANLIGSIAASLISNWVVQQKAATYTLLVTDDWVRFTATATCNLPAVSAVGQKTFVVSNDSSAGVVTLDANGSEVFFTPEDILAGVGRLTMTLYPGDVVVLQSNGLAWRVLSHHRATLSASVFNSTTQTIATSTFTVVTFDSEDADAAGMHSTSSNTGRITVPDAGWYFARARVSWQLSATGVRGLILRKNGSTQLTIVTAPGYTGGAFSYGGQQVSGLFQLAANDYLEPVVFQDSGGNLTVGDSGRRDASEFQLFRIR